MASSWIIARNLASGKRRYRVLYKPGGREAPTTYGGTFARLTEARARKRYIDLELAAMRLPVFDLAAPAKAPTLAQACEAWRAARLDVSEQTRVFHRVSCARVIGYLGPDVRVDAITAEQVAAMVTAMATPTGTRPKGYSRETVKKSKDALAMVFDHYGVDPNPARDRRIKLPHGEARDLVPPLAEHVETVAAILPRKHVYPFFVLDATGCRIGELVGARVGDLDERRQAFLVRSSVAKNARPRWVDLPDDLYAALLERIPPREDRDLDAPLFADLDAAALRTAITKACKATGTPHFSPHSLRRRRGSLLQKAGRSLAEVAEALGDTKVVAAEHYVFALGDYREVIRAEALERAK
jgi:integrase